MTYLSACDSKEVTRGTKMERIEESNLNNVGESVLIYSGAPN